MLVEFVYFFLSFPENSVSVSKSFKKVKKVAFEFVINNIFHRTTFGRYDEEEDDSSRIAGGRFRSRFLRGDDEDASGGNRSSMYEDGGEKNKKPERIKVVDTEDCSRGPLSGCIRLADSSRVIQRLKVRQ